MVWRLKGPGQPLDRTLQYLVFSTFSEKTGLRQ